MTVGASLEERPASSVPRRNHYSTRTLNQRVITKWNSGWCLLGASLNLFQVLRRRDPFEALVWGSQFKWRDLGSRPEMKSAPGPISKPSNQYPTILFVSFPPQHSVLIIIRIPPLPSTGALVTSRSWNETTLNGPPALPLLLSLLEMFY